LARCRDYKNPQIPKLYDGKMYKTHINKENPMNIGKSTLSPFAKAVLAVGEHHLMTPTKPDISQLGDPYGEHAEMFGVGGPGFVHHIIEETPHAV
jgi:hypothetical protein